MSLLFIDAVSIIPVTTDATDRSESEGVATTSKAFIEFEDKIAFNSNGQPTRPVNFIMLPPTASIKYGDYIIPTLLRGVAASTEEGRKRKVTSVFPVAGLGKNSHLEVRMRSGF